MAQNFWVCHVLGGAGYTFFFPAMLIFGKGGQLQGPERRNHLSDSQGTTKRPCDVFVNRAIFKGGG